MNRVPRGIGALSLAGFFGIFSTTMSKSPVLPLFVKSLSGSETVIGLIAAVSPFAGVLFSFPVGMLADRWGKKRLLTAAAGVLLAAPLLYLLVQNPFWLIPIRFFHGIATAILVPVA
jgi:DHA1 family multidrug resistance protein-like MFS transporter